MAEGFVFTSATDTNDLLNQIVSQAGLHGWTQDSLASFSGLGRRGHISRDGVTVNLVSYVPTEETYTAALAMKDAVIPAANRFQPAGSYAWEIGTSVPDILGINVSTSYNGSLAWNLQPQAETHAAASPTLPRFSMVKGKGVIGKVYMFFYDNPSSFVVVCEMRPGQFYWLTAGNLQKDYDFAGGQFYGASHSDTNTVSAGPGHLNTVKVRFVHGDLAASRGNGWGASYGTGPSLLVSGSMQVGERIPSYKAYNPGGSVTMWSDVQNRGYEPATGRLWMHPPLFYAVRPNNTNSYVGVLPHVHYVTTENFIGADIVSVGGQEYMIFPANWRASPYSKTEGLNGELGSPWYRHNHLGSGFAVRKPA